MSQERVITKKSIALIGAVLFAGLLTACGAAGAETPDDSPSTPIETTTTQVTATTSAPAPTTTAPVVEAAAVAGKGGAPTDPMAVYAVTFYETEPLDGDLSCDGLAQDITTVDQFFDPANAVFVAQAITERAAQEGCPIS